MEHTGLRRRSIIKGGAWSAPVIVATAAMPAQAASPTNPDLGVLFDGGGGADGYLNSVYVDLGVPATGTPMTLQAPLVMTLNVEGLLTAATDERAFTVSASLGSVSRGAYNVSTRTTTITWTLPAGTKLPKVSTASGVPDILFTFQDGESKTTTGRIKNKIVITSVTGGTIVTPSSTPIDSSVVRDVNRLFTDEGVAVVRPGAARRCRGEGRGLPMMGVLTQPVRKTSTCLTLPSRALT